MSVSETHQYKNKLLAQRPPFTTRQQQSAHSFGNITSLHHAARPYVATYPIDNVEPDIVMDRDDGIYVETERTAEGGYRAHVTIADVAAHVGLDTDIARTAILRAFTFYGAGWTDPMFMKALEEKMSLEHGQERLGFTVTIDLDAGFRPRHTEFRPVIARPENMSYARVTERIHDDPQLQQMNLIARGICDHYFQNGSDKNLFDGFYGRDFRPYSKYQSANPEKMVATYMLLANSCMARFFEVSKLPWLYRNFDSGIENARAYYYAGNLGHDALRRDQGLHGAYCHFTSPIRRAPDFINAHMAHFAFDRLNHAEEIIALAHPRFNSDILHNEIWTRGAKILCTCFPEAENHVSAGSAAEIIVDILTSRFQLDFAAAQETAWRVIDEITQKKPPLSYDKLSEYAEHINRLNGAPEIRRIVKQEEMRAELAVVDEIYLKSLNADAFSAFLRKAAVFEDIPSSLYDQALRRINAGAYNRDQDGFSILFLAAHPHSRRWRALKREILGRIKHEPSSVNGILSLCGRHFGEGRLNEREALIQNNVAAIDGNERERHTHISILTFAPDTDALTLAPSFYSVGNDKRAALSHARYSFIEHYAFGELQPVDQSAMPNILYAALDMAETSRRALVEEMVAQGGGNIAYTVQENEKGMMARVEIANGRFGLPFVIEADGRTAEDASSRAMRHLLRDSRFKHVVAPPLQVSSLQHPQQMLADYATRHGLKIEHIVKERPKQGFHAQVRLTDEIGRSGRFYGEGPNIDRATCAATVKALIAFGLSPEGAGDINARGWPTEYFGKSPILQAWHIEADDVHERQQSPELARPVMPDFSAPGCRPVDVAVIR